MPSRDYPPFPDDVEIADVPIIDYALLQKGDEAEYRRVFEVCQGIGFFLIKNHGVDSEAMFDLADETFALPTDYKMQFLLKPGSYFGYKRKGAQIVDDKGTPDSMETYHISKDDILGVDPKATSLAHPSTVVARRAESADFMVGCHDICTKICEILAVKLGLPEDAFSKRHDINKTGGNHIRLTGAPPITTDTIALGEHSDFGGVTILFNNLGGLQVMIPGTRKWVYLKPQKGLACVNLGDAMYRFSGGRLISGLHRVCGPPGEQAKCFRTSVVYFARPNGDARMGDARLSEAELAKYPTADEWIERRVRAVSTAEYTGTDSYWKSRGEEHTFSFMDATPDDAKRQFLKGLPKEETVGA